MLQGLSTEAFARRSARRPWITIGLWVVTLVVAYILVGRLLEDGLTTEFVFVSTPEPQKGVELIEESRGLPISTNEVVIVQSDTSTVDAAAFEAFETDLYGKLVALGPDIIRLNTLTNYYQTRDPFMVSEDRMTTDRSHVVQLLNCALPTRLVESTYGHFRSDVFSLRGRSYCVRFVG